MHDWPRRFWTVCRQHPIAAVLVPLFLMLGVSFVFRRGSDWQQVYVAAARTLLDGGNMYAGHAYVYPPFAVVPAIPFVPLPYTVARIVWYLVNVVSVVVMARSAWAIAGGPRLGGIGSTPRREWWIVLIGATIGGTHMLNTFAHQQSDLVIGALLMAGCLQLLRGREMSAAVLLSLAAAIKGPPLLFAAYLIWRRRWSASAMMLVVVGGASFIPDLIGSPPGGGTWLQYWWAQVVAPSQLPGMPVGAWFSAPIYNQSLGGAMQRWFGTMVEPQTLKVTTYGIMLLLLATSLAASMRGQRIATRSPVDAALPSQTALELAATTVLALMLSPMTGLAHCGVLILPAFCLARLALIENRRWALIAVLAALAIALTGGKDLVGKTVYEAALWSGAPLIGMVVLWLGCIVALAHGQGLPAQPSLSRLLLPWRPRGQPG